MVLTQPKGTNRQKTVDKVSIPLWFSRNWKFVADSWGEGGFHTTMVLTQQLLLQKLYRIGGGEVKSIEFLCWEDIQSKDKGVLGF